MKKKKKNSFNLLQETVGAKYNNKGNNITRN